MALKAGRVGVAPDQVDEFGAIKSEVTSGYTKQEADAKFETQTHAASTYETKTEAVAALEEKQPIQLSVPIELLSGSALTVETALDGLNDVENDIVKNGILFRGTYPGGTNYSGDVNDLTSGIVYCDNQATHSPVGWCLIITFVGGKTPTATYMGQIALSLTTIDNRMFYRAKVNNVWNVWSEIQMKTS